MVQNDSFPLPVEEELRERIAWLIRLRWVVAAGILVSVWVTKYLLHIFLPEGRIYLICLGILLYNTAFFFYLTRIEKGKSTETYSRFAIIQILLDWLVLLLLIHYSGGIESPVIFYFFFHTIISSILLSPKHFYLQPTLGVSLVGLLAILECKGFIGHVTVAGFVSRSHHQNPKYVLGILFFFASALYISAYFATSILKKLRERDELIILQQRDLRNSHQRIETLYTLSNRISSTLDLKEVLESVARKTTEALNVKACSVRLLDQTRKTLDLGASYGLSEGYLQKGPVDADKSLTEALKGESISILDVTKDPRVQYPKEARKEGIASMLAVPLIFKGRVIGTLRLHRAEVHGFSPEEKDFAFAIANTVSAAITNAMAYKKLLEFDKERSRLMMMVAHEMRAPASAIQGILKTVLDGYLGEVPLKQKELLSRAEARTHSFLALINDLLDLGADEAGLADKEFTATSLGEALDKVLQLLEVKAKEKNMRIEVKTPKVPLIIQEVEGDMEKLFTNLIGNALKYSLPNGKVSIQIGMEDKSTKIVVSDTGIGIPSEEVSHVFEEFNRAKNARRLEKEGTGLGLPIVKRIVERYNGKIWVESELDKGTVFTIIFPRNKIKATT